LKALLAGGRFRFSTSAFVMDYTNLQVQTPIGIGVLDIRNAAAATIRGVELEGTSLIGRGIEAGGHLAWLDATYDGYIAVAVEGFTGDVSGNRLNNAPELAGRVWIEWTGDIGHSRRLSLSAESTAQSTVLSSIGLTESAIDAFGTALWLVALFVFLAAGAAILFNQEWWRQLAIIDRNGGTAAFSGARVGVEKDEAHGQGCVAIANIVRSPKVPRAMVQAFEAAQAASLAQRLVGAVRAGEAAGGEFQPVVSAALLVVHRESFPYIDLRVDQNASPIEELARLVSAYEPEADTYVIRAVDPHDD